MIERNVRKNNKEAIERWFEHSLYLERRIIFIGENIDSDAAEKLYKQLAILETKQEPITIMMNCFGGEYMHGMGMYDAIKDFSKYTAPVTFKVYGSAMSMGSMLLQAGDSRIISENSVVMVHYGYTYKGFDHTITNEKWGDYQKKDKTTMENMYLEKIREKHPKFTRAKMKEMLNFDTILKGQEAVDMGLADGINGKD